MPGNASLAADSNIKKTFMAGGYYRYDVSDNLSVLVLNSQYVDKSDDRRYQKSEGDEMLDWLESNLSEAANTDRKFIITDHVYAGARFLEEKMWDNNKNERFF